MSSQFVDAHHRYLHDTAKQAYVAVQQAHAIADQAWREYIEYGKLHSDDSDITTTVTDDSASPSPGA